MIINFKNNDRFRKYYFQDFFSLEDKGTLDNIAKFHNVNNEHRNFINKLLKNNKVEYIDNLNLLESFYNKYYEKNIRTEFSFLSKFYNLDINNMELSISKINAIINNELYLASPREFNDPCDSLLLIDPKDYLKCCKNQKEFVKHVELWQTIINYLPDICCFSLCEPTNIDTRHMWGYYAGSECKLPIKTQLN